MAVKVVNDSIGLDGISPTLAAPKCISHLGLNRDLSSFSIYQQALAVKRVTNALTKHFTRRQVHGALQT